MAQLVRYLLYKHENLELDPQCHITARHGNMPETPELGAEMSGSLGFIDQPV